MKKSIIAFTVAAVSMLSIQAQAIENERIRASIGVVTESDPGVITIFDVASKNLFQYEKEQFYKVGDLVSVVFDIMNTTAVSDDEIIIDPVVCGMVEAGETQNAGLVENVEDPEDDVLEWFSFGWKYYMRNEDY